MVKIEYQYLNGESVLDSCGSCTGLELIINTDNYPLCGQKYFELRVVNVVYDDLGNQIIYFTYNGDVYGTTMTFNDFVAATQGAFDCPPNPQCIIQETSFDWSITPQMGDKYISDNIVRPAGTSTNYIYSFLDLTINGITYLLGDIWDDATQGKACDNVMDYINAIIYYISNQSIPEYLGANNLAENGMSNNYNGDGLLELYFLPGTTVNIQIQDTGSNVGNFVYDSSLIVQAVLSINNTSVVDSGDVIIAETLEVSDGELERAQDNTTQPIVIYNAYEYEYNFNFQKGLVVSLCIDTQSDCVLNNFAQIIVTPTQMQSVFGGATISGSTGTSNTAPVNILAPYIFGMGAEGGILNVNSGAWTGVPTPSITYDWQYSTDGGLTWNSYIPAEISTSYSCLSTDVGNLIRCEVTATNIAGVASSYTNSILIVAGGNCAPSNVVSPSISGSTTVGSILTASNGTWVGATSYSYNWLRNGISLGVITSTYTTVSADAGQNIQCIVTGINAFGQTEEITNNIVPTIAPTNTSIPIVYGDVSVGSVLSVYEGEWDGNPIPSYAYNWQYSNDGGVTWNNFSPLQLGSTYTIVSGDLGNTIRCQVDATNIEGLGSADSVGVLIPLASTPTAPTFAVNPTMNVLGAYPMVGVYLEITDGMCNGSNPITFSYQWKNNGSPIIGETNSTYEIQLSDFGDLIECEVTASNGVLPNATFTPTGITVVQKPINTVLPSVSGLLPVGSVLTATTGTWTGNATITYSYQWRRNLIPISLAISSTYTTISADAGQSIDCVVTANNAYGNDFAYTSNTITPTIAPSNFVTPKIYGSTIVGETLSIYEGGWNGFPAPLYTYKWQYSTDGGTTWNDYSPSEIGSTYTIQSGEGGRNIKCIVTGTNPLGVVSVDSNVIEVCLATVQRPLINTLPVVSGNDYVGGVLTTTDGTWLNSPTSYNYQWKRGATNVGTNSTTYTQVAADAGFEISCVVTAVNAGGSEPATSNSIYCFDTNFKNGTNGVIDFAIAQGYTLPSTTQLQKFNAHLIGLKALGVFATYDRHWGGVANNGSENFGRINWKSPSLGTLLTPVNSPTWVSNLGYVCNAANSYVSTNYNPAVDGVNYTLNNAGRYFFTNNRTSTISSQTIDGNAAANNNNTMRCANAATQNNINSGTNLGTAANAGGYGFHCITRTASNVVNRHYDLNNSMTTASTAITSSVQFICRSGTTYQSGLPICMYAIGGAVPLANIPILKKLCEQLYFNL